MAGGEWYRESSKDSLLHLEDRIGRGRGRAWGLGRGAGRGKAWSENDSRRCIIWLKSGTQAWRQQGTGNVWNAQ